MTARVPVLTYHAVESGPAPLCVEPALFEAHLDCLLDAGVTTLTVAELGAALRAGALPARSVAITFDDGFSSVAREAAPRMTERGLRGTIFCVAGHLGATNDWPTQPGRAPRLPLAAAGELAELARAGFEIGSHGTEHAPLGRPTQSTLDRELNDSKRTLEAAVGVAVTSFAYPYGAAPVGTRRAVESAYSAACGGALRLAEARSDIYAIPRVDAHYVRRPELLRRVLEGSAHGYLRLRRLGARARRVGRKDYARAPSSAPRPRG